MTLKATVVHAVGAMLVGVIAAIGAEESTVRSAAALLVSVSATAGAGGALVEVLRLRRVLLLEVLDDLFRNVSWFHIRIELLWPMFSEDVCLHSSGIGREDRNICLFELEPQ